MTFQITEESYFIFLYKQKMAFQITNKSFIRSSTGIFSHQIVKKNKREEKRQIGIGYCHSMEEHVV